MYRQRVTMNDDARAQLARAQRIFWSRILVVPEVSFYFDEHIFHLVPQCAYCLSGANGVLPS